MAALSRRLRPLRGPSSHERLWLASGCPSPRLPRNAARGSRKVIPCCARGVYGVRWRLSRFFRLLLECLCGASLQFLRASAEQLLTSPESNYLLQKNSTKPTNT